MIEVSDDGRHWTKIDKRSNCSSLSSKNKQETFIVQENDFSRFCRFRHNGEFWNYSILICSGFNQIEFYGILKIF